MMMSDTCLCPLFRAGSGVPKGMPEPARNNGHKQVSLIIIKSHQGSGGKTKHGLPPVNGNAEERF
ncbi:hypothetical protein, partial [Enterobacter asburiae]|uniref:hypothetical protein n=1 Tax=Enterobacter asburiae TaxID=61645 RepID=UPI001E417DA9